MRVLLTTLNAKYIHINLALRYLRACCRDLPIDFLLEEFTINDRPENIAGRIYRHRPDLVACSCYIWNLEPTLAVLQILKTIRPELPVLCGGPEVSFDAADFLSRHPEIDLIITGEGEMPFRALMEQLAYGCNLATPAEGASGGQVYTLAEQPATKTILVPEGQFTDGPAGLAGTWFKPHLLAAIPGLAWRWEGQIRLNPPAPVASPVISPLLLKDAAGNPPAQPGTALSGSSGQETTLPAYHQGVGAGLFPLHKGLDAIPFPYEEDLAAGGNDLQQRTVYYETSRGCPFACGFCLSSTTTGLRYFSLERVREDLARLLAAGVREIKFVDRTFNAHKKRALAIWEYLPSLRPRARFYFEIAGDHLDEDMLSFLSQVPPGLFQFEIGVQTIDAAVNARCNRRQDWERLAANIRRLQVAGNIRLHLDLIAGLPGEGYAGVGQSFDAVAALKPHEIQLGFLKLLKGTDLRARAREFGYLFLDRPPYQVLASNAITCDEMLSLHDIEAILKVYGNSHLADHALGYLVQTAFGGSPFACYQALAAWWEAKGLFRRSHSQRDLFNHLAAFVASLTVAQLDRFYQLLKFDFLCHDRSRHWPRWVPPSPLTEEQRSAYLAQVSAPGFITKNWPVLAQEAPTSLRRHGFIELFPCHPEKPAADTPTLAFFYYGPPGRVTRVFYLPLIESEPQFF